MLGVATLDVEV